MSGYYFLTLMFLRRALFAGVAFAALLSAQAPTAPVISARGVTNFFTQEPAPGTVGLGGLVQITGLNLGPPDAVVADSIPWPTRLGGSQVVIGGKQAALYSVSSGTIIAQVPVDANTGLVNVIVRRGSDSSAPAKVTVAATAPSVRTADDSGAGIPWGQVTADTITTTATGLGTTDPKIDTGNVGPTDTPAVPTAVIEAYVGGLRAKVTATASTKRPGEFDITITVPQGARAGDLITLLAGRQAANSTVFNPMKAAEVVALPLPKGAPAITALTDSGVNGAYLIATAARGTDGCYPALTIDVRAKKIGDVSDCLTSVNANIQPLVVPPNGDTVGALVGPPAGDAQSGISSTVMIYSAAGDPVKVSLPSAASTLTANPVGYSALLPGTPPQLAAINPITGDVTTAAAGAGAGGGGGGNAGVGAGGAPGPTLNVNVNGLTHVYASANVGQNRIGVLVGDDSLKPAKAAFAVLNGTNVVFSKDFPVSWLPLLTAVPPARPNQTTPPAAPTEPFFFDTGTRQVFAIARAADASKDAFVAFPTVATADPKIVAFPDGWFATSCTADIRIYSLDLVGQLALAGSRVAETEFKTACPASGFVTLDLAGGAMTAIPVGDQGQIRVPTSRTDTSAAEMNNYVYALKLDSTRTTSADTLYVLDGVNGNVVTMPVPNTVNAFVNASLQEIPEINSLLVQAIDRTAGDQGFVLFNLDAGTVSNLPLPDGFVTVNNLVDGATPCCLATRKLVARALKAGGSSAVIYDLVTGDVVVVPNPDNVTSIGPPAAANAGGGAGGNAAVAARLVLANSQANTISAIAYAGTRQVGVVIIRVP
jgi:uncharacterized protein (TIGR03437 family)